MRRYGDSPIYDDEGNCVYDPEYEDMKVERECFYCGSVFDGMPDHGVCPSCADKIERGDDLYE